MKQKPEIRDRIKELRRVCATELVPAPVNWRTHSAKQRTALASVLEEIGIADAVLARELPDGRLQLIDGHLRRETLGESLLPVLVLDVSEREAAILLATIDPLAAMAGADVEKLDAVLREATATTPGVQEFLAEIADNAGLYKDDEKEIVEDEVPEPPPEPITRPGDLWILGDHRLLCGDSTKADDVERLMAGAKADIVVSDPPYGVSYVGKTKDALLVHNDGHETLLPLLDASLGNAAGMSNPGAVWYIAAPAGPQFYDFATVLRRLEVWRQTLVWAKQSLVMGHSDYHYQHEAIFYGWTPGGPHQPPPDRKQTTLWTYDRPTASREHPTMKPVALFAKMIENSSKKGQVVIDPFLGSGTTLIAAEQLGRRCYGMEISPQYCDVIVKRWETLTGRKAVREQIADGPPASQEPVRPALRKPRGELPR